jgi:uncharacterized membrane protein
VIAHKDDRMTTSTSSLARPYSRLTVGTVALLAGVILGVWLLGTPSGLLGKADAVGYAICHRIDVRSFHTHDRPLPLCARCTGIYLGVITGLVFLVQRGRGRSSGLPPTNLLLVMALSGAALAFDGLNSYLSLFAFYRPLYQPHNTLRLITGMGFGLAMISVVLPVFNSIAWADPDPAPALRSFKEMGVYYGIGAGVCAAVLIDQPTLRAVLGMISAVGVVLMFGVIGTVTFLIGTRRENTITRWRDLLLPVLAGAVFTFAVIGGIDAVRYWFTGTWEGFIIGS